MRLDPADIEAIAQRTAELIAQNSPELPARYLDAAQLARVLGVDREWVYAHARQLGAIRLGCGRARLRFDLQHATHALERPRDPGPAGRPPRRASHRRAGRKNGVDLLPYAS